VAYPPQKENLPRFLMGSLTIPAQSDTVGSRVVELGLPDGVLIVLLKRNDELIVPSGGTVLEAGDTRLGRFHVLPSAVRGDSSGQ
jgi:NhaP-type Na+/H+ and K+/H+ antiporter